MALALATLLLASTTVAAPNGANSTHENVVACCRSLDAQYKGLVYYTNDIEYAAWDDRWTESATLGPWCIFTPESAKQVSTAVKTFATAAGRDGFCPFAINSGGGMGWAGANDIKEGITLDLRLINKTEISDDRSYVSLGAGGNWKAVYKDLQGSNLAIPGGRNEVVGVGGTALGGGYSWLTPQVGWVADNVLNFEIVLASGEIINANRTSSSDLHTALKGGGNNFGVVTRFDIAAIEHNQKLYGGEILMSRLANESAIAALNHFMDVGADDPDVYATVRLNFFNAGDGLSSQFSTMVEYVALDNSLGHPALDGFLGLPSEGVWFNHSGHTTFSGLQNVAYPAQRALPSSATFKSFPNSSHVVLHAIQKISTDVYYNNTHVRDLNWEIEYQPLPLIYRHKGAKHGPNVLGLNYTDADLMMVHLQASWKFADDDEAATKAVETWLTSTQEYINVRDVGYVFASPNYAGPTQNVLLQYGVPNLGFLQKVAKKYDPDELFQHAVPGGFKIKDASP